MARAGGSPFTIFNGKLGAYTKVVLFENGVETKSWQGAFWITQPEARPTSFSGKSPLEKGSEKWFDEVAVMDGARSKKRITAKAGTRGSTGGSRFITLKVFNGRSELVEKLQAGWAAVKEIDEKTQQITRWEIYAGKLSKSNRDTFLEATKNSAPLSPRTAARKSAHTKTKAVRNQEDSTLAK